MKEIDPIIPVLGCSLIAAFITGKVAHRLKIPKVTGFIIVGLIMGPSFFNTITEDIHHKLSYVSELALGLILFNIGGEFHRELLTKIGWRLVRYATLYCFFVFLIVMSLGLCLTSIFGFTFMEALFFSVFTAVISVSSAPPTTLLVMKEYESKGIVTDHIIIILAVGTIGCIVGSEICMIIFQELGIFPDTGKAISTQSLLLLWKMVGSVLIGVALGFSISFLEQLEKSPSEILLAIACVILLGLTLSHYLHLEPMLVSFFIGFSLVNFSHAGEDLHHHIKSVGLSMYALFFILAGAHIDLSQLKTIGVLGIIYIIARSSGKVFATFITTKIMKEDQIKGPWLGFCLFSHAGVALGIVAKFGDYEISIINDTVKTIVSSIFFFEIVGPILIRYSLMKSREVTVSSLIGGSASTGIVLTLPEMIKLFLKNLGIKRKQKEYEHIKTISPLVQRKIYAIQADADFEHVIKYIDEHHMPIYPVINNENSYQGLVCLTELKNVMFDAFLSKFVVASDLIGGKESLQKHTTLEDADEKFKNSSYDTLPVLDAENKKLIGIITHKAVIMAIKNESANQS